MTAREWHRAIIAAYPDRAVCLKTVYNWLSGRTKTPDWAIKLRGLK